MDLKRLELLIAVSEEQSYGRAARRLGIAQPNVSRSIAALEAELGVKLFARSARGATLTGAGTRFLPRAITILNEAEAALAEIGELGPAGDLVRLGCSAGLLEYRLSNLFAAPLGGVSVEVVTGTREVLARQLIGHEIDVGYCVLPELMYGSGRGLSDLQFEPTGHETLAAFATDDHPAHRDGGDLIKLSRHRWAIPGQLSVLYRWESLFFRAGTPTPIRGLLSGSLASLADAARHGGMVAILPIDFASPGLTRLAEDAVLFPYIVGLLIRRGPGVRPAVATLMEALRNA